jgi:hypothetical protein
MVTFENLDKRHVPDIHPFYKVPSNPSTTWNRSFNPCVIDHGIMAGNIAHWPVRLHLGADNTGDLLAVTIVVLSS